ncbi:MAG: tRNA lysidine(34) synthetase TilS, partial [Bdellovibrionia bacterium]
MRTVSATAGRSIRKKIWTSLEANAYRLIGQKNLTGRHLLACASGGLDSTALLNVLSALAKTCKLKVTVAHVHHGDANSDPVARDARGDSGYRDRAAAFVAEQAENLGFGFVLGRAEGSPASEAELRKARYLELQKIKLQTGAQLLTLAHHRDDLLETRLIRLIRGVGPEGLKSMSILNGNRFRPFLQTPRVLLEDYLNEISAGWLEDPSNESDGALRNWIRLQWLPQLERKRPGAGQALARSLEALTLTQNHTWVRGYFDQNGIQRGRLNELGPLE